MNKDESLELFAKGRDVWNAWAQKLLDTRDALKANGKWVDTRNHLRWNEETRSWHEAAAADFSIDELRQDMDFSRFVFPGDARFGQSTFLKAAWFQGASFLGEAQFFGVTFSGDAQFWDATFQRNAPFDEAVFLRAASFRGVTFSEHSSFHSAKFTRGATFYRTKFLIITDFEEAVFSTGVSFEEASFLGEAGFNKATFSDDAKFDKVTFSELVRFSEATFTGNVCFNGVAFSRVALFEGTTFEGRAVFEEANFSDNTWFSQAQFSGDAVFSHTQFSGDAGYDGVSFLADAGFQDTAFLGRGLFKEAIFGRGAWFPQAIFERFTTFDRASFRGAINFGAIEAKSAFSLAGATFLSVPDFIQAHFSKAPRLDDCRIEPQPSKLERYGKTLKFVGKLAHSNKTVRQRFFGMKRARFRRYVKEWMTAKRWTGLFENIRMYFKGDSDLAARWRALKRLAIQGHDHAREQTFFKGELKARRWSEDKPWDAVFWFGVFYQVLSDFGRSLLRPLLWWGVSVVCFAGLYVAQHPDIAKESSPSIGSAFHRFADSGGETPSLNCVVGSGDPWVGALTLSIQKGLLVSGVIPREKLNQIYACLYGVHPADATYDALSPKIPDTVTALGFLQYPLSAALIFLSLLATRNHFRIK